MWKFLTNLFKKHSVISFKQGLDLTELPVCTFYQGDRKLNLLLDTGSNNSVIDSNILENIEHTSIDETTTLTGVEGTGKEAHFCEIAISYDHKIYRDTFVVSDLSTVFTALKKESGVQLHGIIGNKFFQKYQYVLDFQSLIAYSKLN